MFDKTRWVRMLRKKRVLVVVLVMMAGMFVLFGCGRLYAKDVSIQRDYVPEHARRKYLAAREKVCGLS